MATPTPSSLCKLRSWHLGVMLALAFTQAGCGGLLYTFRATSASSTLEEAQALGAERHAPYAYWSARAHLEKAREEASQAQYGDAWDLATEAEVQAVEAVNQSRRAQRGRGR